MTKIIGEISECPNSVEKHQWRDLMGVLTKVTTQITEELERGESPFPEEVNKQSKEQVADEIEKKIQTGIEKFNLPRSMPVSVSIEEEYHRTPPVWLIIYQWDGTSMMPAVGIDEFGLAIPGEQK